MINDSFSNLNITAFYRQVSIVLYAKMGFSMSTFKYRLINGGKNLLSFDITFHQPISYQNLIELSQQS